MPHPGSAAATSAAAAHPKASLLVGLTPTNQRIVAAAIDAFADRGYHATTTRDIAQRAGLSPAGLYVHYPSKAAVLTQVSLLGHQAALTLIESTLTPTPPSQKIPTTAASHSDTSPALSDPLDRLRTCVEGFTAWHARHHLVARVVQNELSALPLTDQAHVARIRRRITRLVTAEIRSGAAAGLLVVDQPQVAARAVLSLCIDVSRWYRPRGPQTPDQIGHLYGTLVLRMLGAQPATEIR